MCVAQPAVKTRKLPRRLFDFKTHNDPEKETSMKRYLVLFALCVSACETPAEIAAREQLDAACLSGNLQACAAVQQRVAAENQALATSVSGNWGD